MFRTLEKGKTWKNQKDEKIRKAAMDIIVQNYADEAIAWAVRTAILSSWYKKVLNERKQEERNKEKETEKEGEGEQNEKETGERNEEVEGESRKGQKRARQSNTKENANKRRRAGDALLEESFG